MASLSDYGPFDAGIGANRDEAFWRDFFRHLTGSGVIDGELNEFAVAERAAGANMSVDVATGRCFIRGHWGELTTLANVAIGTADATNPRIDRVVLRADFTANTISVEVLEGTPAGSPSAPALTQSASRWEVSLAQISVPASDTTISTAQITDERNLLVFALGSAGVPAGSVTPYAGATAPTGWLFADGSAVSRSTYAGLFAVVGTTYGVGDGSTTFNVPNLKGRMPVGFDSSQTEFDALGETGGAKTHTLTEAEMPAHTHGPGTYTVSARDGNTPGTGGDVVTTNAFEEFTRPVQGASASTGSGNAHQNLPPYIAVNFIVKT